MRGPCDLGRARWKPSRVRRSARTARFDPQTKAYLERKRAEDKTKREALRCLKRHLARRVHHLLSMPAGGPDPSGGQCRNFREVLDIGASNLDLVRSIYANWERGDFSRSDWADPDIEFVLADGPEPGRWRGVAAMAKAWSQRLSPFDEYRTTGHDYRMLDEERILVFVAHSGRGKSSGLEVADLGDLGQPAALFHMRDRRVTRLVVYTSRDRAFDDLGLEG